MGENVDGQVQLNGEDEAMNLSRSSPCSSWMVVTIQV